MEPRLPTVHSKRVLRVFSEAAARRRQIGRVDEGHGLGPTRRPLDQWQPQMEQSIAPALLEQVTQVYGGGDTAVTSDKDLAATEGTHYAGPS